MALRASRRGSRCFSAWIVLWQFIIHANDGLNDTTRIMHEKINAWDQHFAEYDEDLTYQGIARYLNQNPIHDPHAIAYEILYDKEKWVDYVREHRGLLRTLCEIPQKTGSAVERLPKRLTEYDLMNNTLDFSNQTNEHASMEPTHDLDSPQTNPQDPQDARPTLGRILFGINEGTKILQNLSSYINVHI
jgi:hypothetical protein